MTSKKRTRKKRTRAKRIIILTFFCLFCAVFLFSGYQLIHNMVKNKAAADAYQGLRTEVRSLQSSVAPAATVEPAEEATPLPAGTAAPKPSASAPPAVTLPPQRLVSMDFSGLQEVNPEIIGWIRGEGTGIDYPIMQTDNNSYYLNHLYNGEYNNNGSIFMDYRNSGDFSDRGSVLYGHHMRNDVVMFGSLKEYKNQDFYDANPTMMLFTPHGDYLIELISGTVEDGNYEFVRFDFESDDDFLSYVDKFRARSTFVSDVEVQADDRIICLCTCSYEWNNARYMVIGRLVPLYEEPQRITQTEAHQNVDPENLS